MIGAEQKSTEGGRQSLILTENGVSEKGSSDTPSVVTDVLSQHYAEISGYFSGLLCLFANHLEGNGSGKED
mgnify:CR=1 FL=1